MNKKTLIWVSVIAFILVAVYFFMQKDDVEEIDGGTSNAGTETPPTVPEPPTTPTNTGGGSSGQLPTGIQLNTEFGEGAQLIKNYMSDAVRSGYVIQFRKRMNIGMDLFADTRKDVSEAIRDFVIGNANVSADNELPLIPETVNPNFLSELKKFKEFLLGEHKIVTELEGTVSKLAKAADFSQYGFRFLPSTQTQVFEEIVKPYGRCKNRDCLKDNVRKLITRELPPTAQNFIDATVRLERELKAEAIRALMESGYKFTGL